MPLQLTQFRWDEVPLEKVTEMVACKRLGGSEFALTQAYFKKGARVPLHAHAAERLVYVLQGVVRLGGDGDDVTAREGDVIVIPPGLSHQAFVLDDAFVLTVTRA